MIMGIKFAACAFRGRLFFVLSILIAPVLIAGYLQAESKPEIVIQKGHTYWVNSLAISDNGKTIVSGSDDGETKIWNGHQGTLMRIHCCFSRQ
jgi:hypothetical protein